MSQISNMHLFFLVLTAVPFSFSGVMMKRSDTASPSATPSLAPVGPFAVPLSSIPPSSASALHTDLANSIPPAPPSVTISQSSALPSLKSSSIIGTPTTSLSMSQTQPVITKPSNSATALPSPSQTQSVGSVADVGPEYGDVVVRNGCSKQLYLWSVGAWHLHGFRNDAVGYGAAEDKQMHSIAPGQNYTEPYRVTCPPALNGTKGYCYDYDKLRRQGVSLKISSDTSVAADALQFEYALVQDPLEKDTYHRLHYDVSLLDCADPDKEPSLYVIQTTSVADLNWRNIPDSSATQDDCKKKVEMCPGYQNGVAVTLGADPEANSCTPIGCDGESRCTQLYYFDRTRKGEPSFSCKAEYKGNMVLDLCVGTKAVGG